MEIYFEQILNTCIIMTIFVLIWVNIKFYMYSIYGI